MTSAIATRGALDTSSVRVGPVPRWARLWEAPQPAEKENLLLARERKGQRWALMQRRAAEHFGTVRGRRVIELGCGRGDLAALFAMAGAEVTLVDASPLALAHARRRFSRLGLTAQYVQEDLLDMPDDCMGQYDISISSGVIEHFAGVERLRAIRAHVDVVRPNGLVMISVPNAACLSYRIWKLYLELRGWWPYGLESPFWRSELMGLARAVQLRACKVYGIGFWQSVGDHLGGLVRQRRDLSALQSPLDDRFGMSLLLMGHKAGPVSKRSGVERHFRHRGTGIEYEMESQWIAEHVSETASVIVEVGCGRGQLMQSLGLHRCVGFDLEADGLIESRGTTGLRLACADAQALPLPDECADLVIAQHVLEHIPRSEAALKEWRRVLKRGGLLLVITPNADFNDPRLFDDPTHVRLFRASLLSCVVEHSGFFVLECKTIGLPWFRNYSDFPGGWRMRGALIGWANLLARFPFLRHQGQSLVCAARKE